MKIKIFLIVIPVLILFSGCQYFNLSSYNEWLDASGNDDKITIYTVGYYSISGVDYACYWENGQLIDLNAGAGSQAFSLYVSGKDVYISGYYADNGSNHVCYWKNGSLYPLPGTQGTIGRRIFVAGGNVYVGGDYSDENRACYWQNGSFIPLESETYSWGRGLYVTDEQDVYLCGFTGTSSEYYPTIWKNGTRKKTLSVSVSTSTAADISVSNGNIYTIALLDYISSTPYLTLWKNDELLVWDSVYSNGTSIIEHESDIYISGSKGTNLNLCDACYWKNGVITYLTSGSTTGSCSNSIYFFGGNVYNCGTSAGEAFYSKNSQLTQLSRPSTSTSATASDIAVVRSIK